MFTVVEEMKLAREFIRCEYGLELTTLDAYRLKKDYVEPLVESLNTLRPKYDGLVAPDIESATRFLQDWYRVPATDIRWMQTMIKNNLWGAVQDSVRILQSERHS